MKYYISDLHLLHENIIPFDGRPFTSVEHMSNVLIANWNNVVTNEDEVYIIGDFCWSKNDSDWISFLKQLQGKKTLILGNHDKKSFSKDINKYFVDIKDYKEITDDGRHIILCHYPLLLYKGDYNPNAYMICGHVHTTREDDLLIQWRKEIRESRVNIWDNQGNIINVGCMKSYMSYTPRSLNYLLGHGGLEL